MQRMSDIVTRDVIPRSTCSEFGGVYLVDSIVLLDGSFEAKQAVMLYIGGLYVQREEVKRVHTQRELEPHETIRYLYFFPDYLTN